MLEVCGGLIWMDLTVDPERELKQPERRHQLSIKPDIMQLSDKNYHTLFGRGFFSRSYCICPNAFLICLGL